MFQRFGLILKAKFGKAFAAPRDIWDTEKPLELMCSKYEEAMVKAGIAVWKEKASFKDANGNNVEDTSSNKIRMKCKVNILYLERLLFADETGCNTNQHSDRQSGTSY